MKTMQSIRNVELQISTQKPQYCQRRQDIDKAIIDKIRKASNSWSSSTLKTKKIQHYLVTYDNKIIWSLCPSKRSKTKSRVCNGNLNLHTRFNRYGCNLLYDFGGADKVDHTLVYTKLETIPSVCSFISTMHSISTIICIFTTHLKLCFIQASFNCTLNIREADPNTVEIMLCW